MTTDEFSKRKKEVLQPIFTEAGAALYDCQSFEFGVAFLLHLLSRLGVEDLDLKQTNLILDGDEKKTAGQLIGMLKKHVKVSNDIELALSKALAARNRLVHRYLVENVERFVIVTEHDTLVREILDLRTQVITAHALLKQAVIPILESLEGISVTDLTDEIKATFMANIQAAGK